MKEYIVVILNMGIGFVIGSMVTYIFLQRNNKKLSVDLYKANLQSEQLQKENNRLDKIEEAFASSFEVLANNILDKKVENISKFTEKELMYLIKPLEKDIKDFKEKVDSTHKESIEKNASLVEKITNLEKISTLMSDEANKLTKALKGDSKIQGDWGEIILERILEQSGLRKDSEYFKQGVGIEVRDDEGVKLKPDFVIKLPDNKNIIVDSKVSIKSYQELINEDDDNKKIEISKKLILSVKNHINDLSSKYYDRRSDIETPDFVFLFIPIDNIFNVVNVIDDNLLKYAWDKKIAIVTPVNLMYLLWIISYMWKQKNQEKNVLNIAKKSGEMYDKFVVFINTLLEIGKSIDKAKDSYEKAYKQLSTGKGNLIKRAEDIKDLGANTKKSITVESE